MHYHRSMLPYITRFSAALYALPQKYAALHHKVFSSPICTTTTGVCCCNRVVASRYEISYREIAPADCIPNVELFAFQIIGMEAQQSLIITPCTHARARGYRSTVVVVSIKNKSTVFLEPIFYLSKYSLSEVYFNTHRLLIEFNGLWYSLAARQVFVAIASLSFG